MILATHALAGAVLGKNITNPVLIVPAALFLHYALDVIPHGEYLNEESTFKNTAWKVAADIFTGFSIILLFVYFKKLELPVIKNIMLGTFFSLFPDLLTLLYWKFNFYPLKKIYVFHAWIHGLLSGEDISWNLKNARNDILISLLSVLLFLI